MYWFISAKLIKLLIRKNKYSSKSKAVFVENKSCFYPLKYVEECY
jgi:hypothetical protein